MQVVIEITKRLSQKLETGGYTKMGLNYSQEFLAIQGSTYWT